MSRGGRNERCGSEVKDEGLRGKCEKNPTPRPLRGTAHRRGQKRWKNWQNAYAFARRALYAGISWSYSSSPYIFRGFHLIYHIGTRNDYHVRSPRLARRPHAVGSYPPYLYSFGYSVHSLYSRRRAAPQENKCISYPRHYRVMDRSRYRVSTFYLLHVVSCSSRYLSSVQWTGSQVNNSWTMSRRYPSWLWLWYSSHWRFLGYSINRCKTSLARFRYRRWCVRNGSWRVFYSHGSSSLH